VSEIVNVVVIVISVVAVLVSVVILFRMKP